MRFVISRTSNWGDGKPCEGAYKDTYLRHDVRTVDDPNKIPLLKMRRCSKEEVNQYWYGEGLNHRVENGQIVRDLPIKAWFIDINSLEELVAFTKEHGDIVFGAEQVDLHHIEIYDDYRE